MATQLTAKKQAFVVEPLNWVAPSANDDSAEQQEEQKQSTPVKAIQK